MPDCCQTKRRCGAVVKYFAAAALAVTLASPGLAASPFLPLRGQASAPAAAQNLCARYAWACSGRSSANVIRPVKMARIAELNTAINRTVRPLEDAVQYRRSDHWALPTRRGGDCEDVALLKKRELVRLGIDPEQLLIATVLDHRRRAHAVLVYRSARGDLVLDSLTDRIKQWQDTNYTFLRIQDPRDPRRWASVLAGG